MDEEAMRLIAGVAVLTLVLGGCLTRNADVPDFRPPAADVAAGHAPAQDRNGPDMSGSTQQPAGSPRFEIQDHEGSASDPRFSGLAVHGRLTESSGQLQLEATATKFSPAHYRVPDGQCSKPWTEAMLGPQGPVRAHPAPGPCMEAGLRDMDDNEAISTALTWDGLLWDSAGHTAPAPAGQYTWQATFHAYSADARSQSGSEADLVLSFQVRVA